MRAFPVFCQLVILLHLECSYCQGYRPAGSSSSARSLANDKPMFVCGEPGNPCGKAIPKGVTCSGGRSPGYCQPGYFCGYKLVHGGYVKDPRGPKCLPLPKDCGKAGNPCCPSNAETPHKSMEDALNRNPFCKDGTYCFYQARPDGAAVEDEYVGNVGVARCRPVEKDCGTGPGSPCCPRLSSTERTNPELPRTGCPGAKSYCKHHNKQPYGYITGTCHQDPPDCGDFGKLCCVLITSKPPGDTRCGTAGQKTCCANPPEFKGPGNRAAIDELVCMKCPDKFDAADEAKQPQLRHCK